jgi:hypothetical protein
MKRVAIAAIAAILAFTSLTSLALAAPADIYYDCWSQADHVRPALDPRGKEGWVANCVANATYDLERGRYPRPYRRHY